MKKFFLLLVGAIFIVCLICIPYSDFFRGDVVIEEAEVPQGGEIKNKGDFEKISVKPKNGNAKKISDKDVKFVCKNIESLIMTDYPTGSSVILNCLFNTGDEKEIEFTIVDSPVSELFLALKNGKFAEPNGEVGEHYVLASKILNGQIKSPYADEINESRESFVDYDTFYFSPNGDDNSDGLTVSSAKRNPLPFIKQGNCNVLLESGAIFDFASTIVIGSNVSISTYNGDERAIINMLQKSEDKFVMFDEENNIFSVRLNQKHYDAGWIKLCDEENWKRVLDFSLVNDGEYYIDMSSGILYLKSDTYDITGSQLEYALGDNGFLLNNGSNALIQNLEIIGAGKHGISILAYSDIVVTNCYIHNIGGAIHTTTGVKYGNGIQVWAIDSNNIFVYNNIVSDCFDAGMTAQINQTSAKADCNNMIFAKNLVKNCNYDFEFFQYGTDYSLKNIIVADNIFYNSHDITNGYRLTQSSINFTAQLCLWYTENPMTQVYFINNFGIESQAYAISLNYKTSNNSYNFVGNKLVVPDCDEPVKFIKNYTGDDNQYDTSPKTSENYKMYICLWNLVYSLYRE